MTDFFRIELKKEPHQVMSKRLKRVVNRMRSDGVNASEPTAVKRVKMNTKETRTETKASKGKGTGQN